MKLPAASDGVWTRFINLRFVPLEAGFGFAENEFNQHAQRGARRRLF
jgi:hypothetical protein